MRDNLGDEARIKHILDAITEVQSYTKDIKFEDFTKNSMMKFAVIKQLEIIGEAANHISEKLKENYSEIEWRQIKKNCFQVLAGSYLMRYYSSNRYLKRCLKWRFRFERFFKHCSSSDTNRSCSNIRTRL